MVVEELEVVEEAPVALDEVHRRLLVSRLWSQRVMLKDIARMLGIAVSTVREDISLMMEEFRAEYRLRMHDAVMQEYFELDAMERKCAEMLSKTGDRGWMSERLKVKERKAKMLGLDVPQKKEVDVKQESRVVVVNWDGSTILEREDPPVLPASGEVWQDKFFEGGVPDGKLLDVPGVEAQELEVELRKKPVQSGDERFQVEVQRRIKKQKTREKKKRWKRAYMRGYMAGQRDAEGGKEERSLEGEPKAYQTGYRSGYTKSQGEP